MVFSLNQKKDLFEGGRTVFLQICKARYVVSVILIARDEVNQLTAPQSHLMRGAIFFLALFSKGAVPRSAAFSTRRVFTTKKGRVFNIFG